MARHYLLKFSSQYRNYFLTITGLRGKKESHLQVRVVALPNQKMVSLLLVLLFAPETKFCLLWSLTCVHPSFSSSWLIVIDKFRLFSDSLKRQWNPLVLPDCCNFLLVYEAIVCVKSSNAVVAFSKETADFEEVLLCVEEAVTAELDTLPVSAVAAKFWNGRLSPLILTLFENSEASTSSRP